MHKKLFVEQPILVNRKGPILLRDNARPHVSQFTIRKIHELGYEIFRNKGNAVNTFVEFINSRTPDFYCNGIGTLVKRWKKCIESNENYFD
ncbi:Histone-lysine N-methyltransferase SETMAR [Habropoda laboriosa]|uniref:Histone-lysine N-methyltransferase SETMAR n=1 Tax=Habropoda laboriosa TaxID=597456 RepID=A0A0L7RHE6_9HYME|nr:Histone-lysine N-methyltransferase SETMAR [Habropoda laboriosa]